MAILCMSSEGQVCDNSAPVGVALLRNNIDIAEPGRGLGLGPGLSGASLALAPSLSSSITTLSKATPCHPGRSSRHSAQTLRRRLCQARSGLTAVARAHASRIGVSLILFRQAPCGVCGLPPGLSSARSTQYSRLVVSWLRGRTRPDRGADRVHRSVLAHERVPSAVASPPAPMACVRGAEAWYV